VNNTAGGFFLSNQLDCDLKKGDKFKKNDILAQDKHFFTNSKLNGPSFNIGSFQKVACMSTSSTFEDGTFITNKLSQDMSSDIVYEKPVVIGKNANVDQIVKVGDRVTIGDSLISFEQSFEEGTLNAFLSNVGKELKEEIKNLGKTKVKAKVSGIIVDIKMYCTVELEELSPSLRKLVQAYYTDIKKAQTLVSKYDKSEGIYKAGILFNEPTAKVDASKDGKVKGVEVNEGVYIIFYLKYNDIMGVGDKVTCLLV
jgi:hypothetical protein